MALSLKARKRLAILILVVGLPAYVVVAVTLVNRIWPDPLVRPSFLAELAIYVGLGILWALPFKWVFKGVARGD